ncbi:unnamed protein product [Gongylonema pulchrum]|uniref:DDE_Tnp_1_7 domain-containing protein n=1 Tax=Gongylonema pulchrum TaxID=637853 RepID=A0A183DER2_9BILA|nr:unnamed protein product [Gongylonema pulchrum]
MRIFCSDDTDSEADEIDISRRLHELVEEGPPTSLCIDESGELLPSMQCEKCSQRHCSCDECRISHIIICGLLVDGEDTNSLTWV